MNYLHTMRSRTLRISSVLFAGCTALFLTAQIPNGGFEDWVDHGNYTEPAGWLTYNDVPTVGGPTVEQGTPGHPGNFHAAITTRQSPGGIMAIQGWISAGTSSDHAGFPFTQRPAALTGQWQYNAAAGDSVQVLVALSKWNGTGTTMVGQGSWAVTGAINGWEPFSVPIIYFNNEVPDTAYIQIVSSIDFGAPVVGSTLRVDDLAFSGVAGVEGLGGLPDLHVLITSHADRMSVNVPQPGLFELLDITGRRLTALHIPQATTTLNVGHLPPGVLLYRFTSDHGQQVVAGKWVKE